MGGPALHVAYLTKGCAERGYETTLAAGTLGRGEGSMSFVADELGVEVVPIPQLTATSRRSTTLVGDVRSCG